MLRYCIQPIWLGMVRIAIALLILFSTGQFNQVLARCYFLECDPGDIPAPPPRSSPPESPTPQTPSRPSVARPSSPYETCSRYGEYTYCVSSVLPPQYGFSYGPEKLTDGRLDTAWVPGQGIRGDGIGEWVVIEFGQPQSISAIQILNGYHKNVAIYAKNNRVQDLEIALSNGHRQLAKLADSPGSQVIELNVTSQVEWVQLIIRSVYRGTLYRDTAITELRIVAQE
jgi:hypothetical protein